ncbi:MAG: hypothetical protein R3230_01365 [Nitrosopumilaceae archaeon]|nr:hypothetical protein [Nitrosopumilaceae archaeon]
MAQSTRSPGIAKAFNDVFPVPIKATRAPTTSDLKYPIGQLWVRTDTGQSWHLVTLSGGSATWALCAPGASDVDTLTGDSGGAISPSAGNITLAGGTNITTVGSGSTITANLDAAISLATSVTSPLYTADSADVDITAPAGQNVVLKLGDAAGSNKLSVTDSSDVEVFAVDSNGGQTYTTITASGLITGNASATINTAGTALTLAADNSADAVILGGGTSARAITIGQDAAAHTVAIGQAAAGAITVDTAAGVSIDAATASNFTLSGAGADLTIASAAGRVIMNGEEAAANAITLLSAAGGIDADCALQMNLASSQAAADAIRINASDASGGIDIDDAGGGIAMDSAGAISIDAAAASNMSVSGAGIDLTLGSAAGRVIVNGEEAAANAITLLSAAGGIDADCALQMNLASSQNAADAIRLNASAGGIDIDAAGAAGEDIDIANAAGSVNLSAGEADAAAISIQAASGGIDVDGALQVNIASSQNATDAVRINASAGGIDIDAAGAAGEDITIDNAAGSVGVSAGEAAADALVVNASAGGLQLLAGGGAGLDTLITNTSGSMTLTAGESASDAMNITASGAAGAINLSAGTGGVTMDSGLTMNVVNKVAGDSPYSVLGTDYVISCDTSAGAITVTLPASPATGRTLMVVDEGGSAGANNITISGNGKNIAGAGTLAATDVIDSNYGTSTLVYNGTFWNNLDVA